jgi:hypothetical protein
VIDLNAIESQKQAGKGSKSSSWGNIEQRTSNTQHSGELRACEAITEPLLAFQPSVLAFSLYPLAFIQVSAHSSKPERNSGFWTRMR